ncbi:MAG: hypothetical protein ACPHP1_01510 [Miltoncostaeaceae bacterium]
MITDPVALADALRAARPAAEPSDLPPEELDDLVRAAGGDPADAALVGRAVVEWERMLP